MPRRIETPGLAGAEREAGPPRRSLWSIVGIAVGAIVVLAAVLVVEELRIRDREEALDRARASSGAAQEAVLERVARLESKVDRQIAKIDELKTGLDRAETLIGEPVADGEYEAMIHMVGGTQSPPMLAFDDEVFFSEPEAVAAAIEDGMSPEEAEAAYGGEFAYYFRNVDPEWRILPIAPDVEIVLQSYRFRQGGGFHDEVVTLERFDRIYHSEAPQKDHFRVQHYWLEVRDGAVVRIYEQNLTP